MRHIPNYVILALTGVLLLCVSVASIMSVEAQYSSNLPIVPTALAMLTKMPAPAAATQLAVMGYPIPQDIQATGMALLKTMPQQAVLETLMAQWLKPGGPAPTKAPPNNPPAGPSPVVPPGQASPTPLQPAQPTPVPLPVDQTPTPGGVPTNQPTPSRVPVGRISGTVLPTAGSAGRIDLRLTRPNGTVVSVPAGAGGTFVFSGMEAGTYTLEATSTGLLSSQIVFILAAGQDMALPVVHLQVGDTNSDNRIDLADAAMIAANFNAPATMPVTDLNSDGWINILDLTLVGHAYGLLGPLPWGVAPA